MTTRMSTAPTAEISRRSLLATTGLVGAGIAAGLASAGASRALAEETAEAEDAEDQADGADGAVEFTGEQEIIDVQVCVLGSGPTGMTAAISAAEAGAQVLLLDRNAFATGNAHSIAACETDFQLALENHETPEEFADFLVHYEDNPDQDRDMALFCAQQTASMIQWLSDHGVEFSRAETSSPEPFAIPARTLVTKYGRDAYSALTKPLEDSLATAGVDCRYETEVLELIFDESGAVVGARAQAKDGHEIVVNAKSVVLATGGFGGDDELLRRYATRIPCAGPLGGELLWTRGDGFAVREGIKLGAEVCTHGGGGLMYKNFEGGNCDHCGQALHVGTDGKRFCDESINRLDRSGRAVDAGYTYVYIIYDADLPASLYTGVSSSGGSATTTGAGSNPLQAALDAGTAFEADTIEGLARQLGINAAVLQDTVDTYNGWCRSGVDEEFGKPAEKVGMIDDPEHAGEPDCPQIENTFKLLNEIKNPPFYATRAMLNTIQLSHTQGGLKISQAAEVLDVAGNPIKNLYSGGEAANGQVLGRFYPTSGTSAMTCYVFGRIAGESAAANAMA